LGHHLGPNTRKYPKESINQLWLETDRTSAVFQKINPEWKIIIVRGNSGEIGLGSILNPLQCNLQSTLRGVPLKKCLSRRGFIEGNIEGKGGGT